MVNKMKRQSLKQHLVLISLLACLPNVVAAQETTDSPETAAAELNGAKEAAEDIKEELQEQVTEQRGDLSASEEDVELPSQSEAKPTLSNVERAKENVRILEEYIDAYEKEHNEYHQAIQTRFERRIDAQKQAVEDQYKAQLKPVLEAERLERMRAIDSFEAFIARYPNEPRYTPDAMFRLAELHFEYSEDDYQQKKRTFDATFDKWLAEGGEGDGPEEPERNYSRTIAIYKEMIRKFPKYRLGDGVHYLLGYSLMETDEDVAAIKMWRKLVKKYPESPFFQEVYFRLGDFYFEQEEWGKAKYAFKKLIENTESKYYDKALYKLAWTNYLVSDFDTAVGQFFELLDFSAKKRKEMEEAGEDASEGSVLEDEALQYVAISFSDDTWERPASFVTTPADEFDEPQANYVQHAKTFFTDEKSPRKTFEFEVAYRLGDILFAQSKNRQAVEALKWALEIDPLNRKGPSIQDLIVQAYEREREFDLASKERDRLVELFGSESAWAKKYENDPAATEEAANLAKVGLYQAAVFYHQQANKVSEAGNVEEAKELFGAAAGAYRQYLELYPRDRDAYDLSYYLAETYYYSDNYTDAATMYKKVRDSTLGKQYRGDAAVALIFSMEKIDQQMVDQGTMDPLPESLTGGGGENQDGPKTIPTREIPELRKQYIAAIDRYTVLTPEHDQVPAFRFKAAALLNAYGYPQEAEKRFEAIIAEHPQHEAAKFAAYQIMDQLLLKKDWERLRDFAQNMQTTIGDESGKFAQLFSGAEFKLAEEMLTKGGKLMEEGRITDGLALLEKGAEEYVRLLDDDPNREFADAMAYNAALSFEKARRPLRAAELYERLYKTYPNSQYAAEGLFRVATKSEQAFEFEKAIEAYQLLVKKYPDSERRVDAQINAALALEGLQRYDQAAREFERFATLFPQRDDAASVFYRASILQKKRKKYDEEIKVLRRFISKYRGDRKQNHRVVEAYVRIADIQFVKFEKAKKARDKKYLRTLAEKEWKNALTAFRNSPNDPTARYYAAKASFLLSNMKFLDYEGVRIKANKGKKQAEELVSKSKELAKLETEYKQVISTYKQAEWSLAALYRIGGLYDDLQKKIFSAPCPDDVRKIDEIACDEYISLLEDKAYAIEEKAVNAYRIAHEKALEFKLSNQWTKKTLEALNLLRPADYPIEKDTLNSISERNIYSLQPVLRNGGADALEILRTRSMVNAVQDSEEEESVEEANSMPSADKNEAASETTPADTSAEAAPPTEEPTTESAVEDKEPAS